MKTSASAKAAGSDGKTAVLTLEKPGKNLSAVAEALMKNNKPDLWELLKPLRTLLRHAKVEYTEDSDPVLRRHMKALISTGEAAKIYKEDYTNLYLSFSSNLTNLKSLADVSPAFNKLWLQIIPMPDLTPDELESLMGRPVEMCRHYSWNAPEFIEADLFPLNKIYEGSSYSYFGYRDNYKFSLAPGVRKGIAALMSGRESVDPPVVKDLPEEKELKRMNFEDAVPSDLLFLSGMYMTGSPLSEKGTLPAGKLKLIRKQLGSREFPDMGTEYPLDRVEMLSTAYFLIAEKVGEPAKLSDPGSFCKAVVGMMAGTLVGTMFGIFLPALKGFTRAGTQESQASRVAKITYDLLRPAAEGWMSLSNIRLRYLCASDEPGPTYVALFPSYIKTNLRWKTETKEKRGIQRFDDVTFPFVLHWIEFLCAIGMVEIAYKSIKAGDEPDILEGLRYVRLTPLGRYALGIDPKYTPAAAKSSYEADYDDTNRILTIIGDNCPYALFLQSISKPVSGKRFRITPESLLDGCHIPSEVEERITALGRIIDIEKHSNLKKITEEAIERTKCLETEYAGYRIFRVNPHLPDFVKLLMSDQTIRRNCIMAENSIILVRDDFMPELRKICRRAGFLPDL